MSSMELGVVREMSGGEISVPFLRPFHVWESVLRIDVFEKWIIRQ